MKNTLEKIIMNQEWFNYNKNKASKIRLFKSWKCKQNPCNYKITYNSNCRELRLYRLFYRNHLFNPNSSSEFKIKIGSIKGGLAEKIYNRIK